MIQLEVSHEQLEAARHNAEAPYLAVEAVAREAGLYERADEVAGWGAQAGERAAIGEIANSIGMDTEQLFTRSKPGLIEETLLGVFYSEGRPHRPVTPISEIGDFAGFATFQDFGGEPVYHPTTHNLGGQEVDVGKEILVMIGATKPIEQTSGPHRRQTGYYDGADYQTQFGIIRVFNFRFYRSDMNKIHILKLPDTANYPEQQQKLV